MSRRSVFFALTLGGLLGLATAGSARAADWDDYLHWPYQPPQYGSGMTYQPLHDGWYVYPKEERIVPQIQGPYYRNFYGGKRILGHRNPHGLFHDWNKKKFYQGNHFALDVF